MTEFSRQAVLEKIHHLLDRTLTPRQVYEWVLGFVVAKGYEEFAVQDPVAAKTVQALMDINEDHKIDRHELKILEYYRQCLSGQCEFISLEKDPELPEIPLEVMEKWMVTVEQEALTGKDKLLHWLRIYVYVFAGYVLMSNFWILFQLGGPWSPKRTLAAVTFPFFIYGGLLALPMQILIKGRFFIATLVLSILAVAYFWFGCFQVLFSGNFYFGKFLVRLCLGAVPASVVIWLLLYEKYWKHFSSSEENIS